MNLTKIHYVYKIINLINNKEYIGVRTHSDPDNDPYMGSSKTMNSLYKIEGLDKFKKIILARFSSREEAEKYECSLLTKEYCNSPNTYNIHNTGEFTTRKHNFRKDLRYDYYHEIREKYKSGMTLKELGNYYSCDGGTIKNIVADIIRSYSESQRLRFNKKPNSGARNTDFDKHTEDIIKLYTIDKLSVNEISTIYKIDGGAIKRRLIENNIELRSHKECQGLRTTGRRRSNARDFSEEIIQEYQQVKNMSLLARKYKCDTGTIKSIINGK